MDVCAAITNWTAIINNSSILSRETQEISRYKCYGLNVDPKNKNRLYHTTVHHKLPVLKFESPQFMRIEYHIVILLLTNYNRINNPIKRCLDGVYICCVSFIFQCKNVTKYLVWSRILLITMNAPIGHLKEFYLLRQDCRLRVKNLAVISTFLKEI